MAIKAEGSPTEGCGLHMGLKFVLFYLGQRDPEVMWWCLSLIKPWVEQSGKLWRRSSESTELRHSEQSGLCCSQPCLLKIRGSSAVSFCACSLDHQSVPTGFGKQQDIYKCFVKLKLLLNVPREHFSFNVFGNYKFNSSWGVNIIVSQQKKVSSCKGLTPFTNMCFLMTGKFLGQEKKKCPFVQMRSFWS